VTATAVRGDRAALLVQRGAALSDSSGLAAALAVQAMTLAAGSPRALGVAAFCAGLATGIRSQVAWAHGAVARASRF